MKDADDTPNIYGSLARLFTVVIVKARAQVRAPILTNTSLSPLWPQTYPLRVHQLSQNIHP